MVRNLNDRGAINTILIYMHKYNAITNTVNTKYVYVTLNVDNYGMYSLHSIDQVWNIYISHASH